MNDRARPRPTAPGAVDSPTRTAPGSRVRDGVAARRGTVAVAGSFREETRGRQARSVRAEWDRAGLASGHAWSPCDVCGEEILAPRTASRPCAFTPGCRGSHRTPAGRPTPLQALRLGLIDLDDVRRYHPADMGAHMAKLVRRLLAQSEEGSPRSVSIPDEIG